MTAIFDLDGTLVDSSNVLANAINYVRSNFNLQPLPKDYIIEQINNPNSNWSQSFYNLPQATNVHEMLFKEYYAKNHDKELVLFDGIDNMLKNLKDNSIKLAVATNGYRDSTIRALNYLNIKDYFDLIVTYEDVGKPKPNPDMLFKITNELNSKKSIFIGDSKRDLLASKAANIEFILVDFVNNKSSVKEVEQSIKEYLV